MTEVTFDGVVLREIIEAGLAATQGDLAIKYEFTKMALEQSPDGPKLVCALEKRPNPPPREPSGRPTPVNAPPVRDKEAVAEAVAAVMAPALAAEMIRKTPMREA